MTPTIARERALGHLALHYRPGDEAGARHLLELLGAELVDNGPSPGADGFCTVLLHADTGHAHDVLFLSRATAAQLALEERLATVAAAELVGYGASRAEKPESFAHLGIRYGDLATLEAAVAGVQAAVAPGGALAGRAELTLLRPRRGLDEDVDALLDASPVFGPVTTDSFARHWIQCFVRTDLCGVGLVGLGFTFELDLVFPAFFTAPPTFGR